MPWTNLHAAWLTKTNQKIKISTGKVVEVWEFAPKNNPKILSAWAKHFRNHYCSDDLIDELRDGTKLSRAEYLEQLVFPDKSKAPGPSIRAGDFAEILAADYLEFILNYWVPRTRYEEKAVRNESVKGSDTIGFKFAADGNSANDTLAVFESKAQFTGEKTLPRLQDAIDDSAKDILRRAESLNAIKRRFLKEGDKASALKVQRFQSPEDNEYKKLFGAVAHWDEKLVDLGVIKACKDDNHPEAKNLMLVVIKGANMMKLVRELYQRAIDEA